MTTEKTDKETSLKRYYPLAPDMELPLEPGFTVSEYPSVHKLPDTAKQIIRIRRSNPGLKNAEIARIVKISPQYVGRVLKKAKEDNISLTSEEMIREASKTVRAHILGERHGCVDPTAATQLQATQMVFDRADPKITKNHNVNVNIQAEIDRHFDLSAFRTDKETDC